MLERGATAPEFEIADLHGEPKTLVELLSNGNVLLAFFKVSCPVCQMTLPFLERLSEVLTGGLQIYGVSQDDARATERFCREYGLNFPMLLDRAEDGYPVSNAFGITHVPSMFVVEPSRKIEWASTGFHKLDLEELGHRYHVAIFRSTDQVPLFKGG
jgi:peroxiredoxin